jgi:hypothetical protein
MTWPYGKLIHPESTHLLVLQRIGTLNPKANLYCAHPHDSSEASPVYIPSTHLLQPCLPPISRTTKLRLPSEMPKFIQNSPFSTLACISSVPGSVGSTRTLNRENLRTRSHQESMPSARCLSAVSLLCAISRPHRVQDVLRLQPFRKDLGVTSMLCLCSKEIGGRTLPFGTTLPLRSSLISVPRCLPNSTNYYPV